LQQTHELGLALKPKQCLPLFRQVNRQDLDRNLAAQANLLGLEHDAHPAAIDHAADLVCSPQHRANERVRSGRKRIDHERHSLFER